MLFLFDCEEYIAEYAVPAGEERKDKEYKEISNIKKFRDLLHDFGLSDNLQKRGVITESSSNPHSILRNVFSNFNRSVIPLQNRRNDRDPIEFDDEYSVQDVVESYLKAFFEDVRSEEYVPSSKGGNSKIDFLLKRENIGIEVKCTRDNLTEKEIGSELSTDIERYREHHDCNILYCFIYDGDMRLSNPSELKELERDGEFPVEIFISPN